MRLGIHVSVSNPATCMHAGVDCPMPPDVGWKVYVDFPDAPQDLSNIRVVRKESKKRDKDFIATVQEEAWKNQALY